MGSISTLLELFNAISDAEREAVTSDSWKDLQSQVEDVKEDYERDVDDIRYELKIVAQLCRELAIYLNIANEEMTMDEILKKCQKANGKTKSGNKRGTIDITKLKCYKKGCF